MSTSLRDAFATPASPDGTTAKIYRVNLNGTVDLDVGGGGIITGVRVNDTLVPISGQLVETIIQPNGQRYVLGRPRTANATTTVYRTDVVVPWNVLPGTSSVANPLVVATAQTGAWRSTDGWGSGGSRPVALDAPVQARYSTSYDFYRGIYCYGAAFSSLAGRSCTSLTLRLDRESSGGVSGAQALYVALHPHESIPAGQPIVIGSAVNVGSLAWGASATFSLPASFGQSLIDGTAKGFMLLLLATGNGAYSVMKGRAAVAATGTVSLGWS